MIFNEEKNIFSLIKSISKQFLLSKIPILIIASGCTDNSIPEVLRAKSSFSNKIIILEEKQRLGKSQAINKCIKYIKERNYKYAFFLDGDVHIEKNSFHILASNMENTNGNCVCALPLPFIKEKKFFNKLAWKNCQIIHEIREIMNEKAEVWPISGYLYLVEINSLPDEIPNLIINDDSYIGLYMLEQNKKLTYESKSKVFVKFPSNISDYFNQKIRTRVGWNQIRRINNQRFSNFRRLQRKILFYHIIIGDLFALFSLFFNELCYLIGNINFHKKNELHIWKSLDSTK